MFRNSLKISWRILSRYKVNTLINIIGLIVAFASAILIMTFILHELGFDNFHEKSSRIYRLNTVITMADGQEMKSVTSSGRLPAILKNEMPEIEEVTRFFSNGSAELKVDGTRFTSNLVYWVDTSFFSIFNFNLVSGNKATCLREPNSLVITKTMADKMFGKSNPLDKKISLDGTSYRVTGIMNDVPLNSQMDFEFLASFSSIERPTYDITDYYGLSFPFYLLFKDGINYQTTLKKFTEISDNHTKERFGKAGINVTHSLQPLSRVHLHSNFNYDIVRTGDIKTIVIFGLLVIFIILIASANYINLMTAQSEIRMRESGLRKVMGANRLHLIWQFLIESLIICFIALALAYALAEIALQPFSHVLNVELDNMAIFSGPVTLIMLLLTIITSLLAGFYPAWIISVSQPVSILKGSKGNKSNGTFSRYLVAFQFGVTVFLIIAVILINLQVIYMQNKELGFSKQERMVVLDLTNKIKTSYSSLRTDLLSNPLIKNVTASQAVPGTQMNIQNCYRYGQDPKTGIIINENRIADHYLSTYDMKLLAGRDFDPLLRTDSASFIINETAAKKLGLKDPVGQRIYVWDFLGTIIGVVSDFHFTSMHQSVEPLVLTRHQKEIYMISIHYKANQEAAALAYIVKTFKEVDPEYVINYNYTEQTFASMYKKEERFNDLILAGSILAIIISVMGLFALTAFSVRRRIKEIGVRKILGATGNQILLMLSSKILLWIIPGMILAYPLAWWAVDKWLDNFAFRIMLINYWWVWILASLIALLVGFFAVYYQSIKVANANPIDSLNYE